MEERRTSVEPPPPSGTRIPREEQAALAERARVGDDEAFGRLYAAFRNAVEGFLAVRVGTPDIAEDLCQETFVLARNNLQNGKYNPSYSFYTYLRNVASLILKRHFADHRSGSPDGAERSEIPSQSPTIDNVMTSCEMLRLLAVCCAKPHQIVAAGFIKYLEWRPREVAHDLAERSLGSLAREFLESFFLSVAGGLDRNAFAAYCVPLLEKLDAPPRDVYPEAEYLEKLQGLPAVAVKELPLKLFFSGNPEASLSDWCDKVKRRARNALDRGTVCRASTPESEETRYGARDH